MGADASRHKWNEVPHVNNPCTGTQLDFAIRDSSGMSDQTVTFTVEPGGTYFIPLIHLPFSFRPADSNCVNGSANPTTPSTTPSSGPSAAASATTPSSSGPTLGQGQPPKASTTSGFSNDAIAASVQCGVAGLLGAAIAAMFV